MTSPYTYAAVPSSTSSSKNEINQHHQHPHTSQPYTTYPFRPHYKRSFTEKNAASAAMPFSPSSTRRDARMKKDREEKERKEMVEEKEQRGRLSFKEQIAAADQRDYKACPPILRDMYFPDFEHDRKYEEAAKEREEYEGIKTWLGGVSAENEKGMGGDVEAGETEQNQEDEDEYVDVDVKREMEMDWPEELCDFMITRCGV
jgi:hypothetical protein